MAVEDYNGFKTTFPTGDATDESGDYLDDVIVGQVFTCPGSGTQEINEIGFWVRVGQNNRGVRLCIYTESGGDPVSLVANSLTTEFTVTAPDVWITFEYSTKPQLTGGTDYFLMMWGNDAAAEFDVSVERSDYQAGEGREATCVYHSTNDPSPGAWAASNYQYAVAAEYQAGGGVSGTDGDTSIKIILS